MNENETVIKEGPAESGQPEAEPRTAESLDAREQALRQREEALEMRERQAQYRAALAEAKLPVTLLDCLDLRCDESAKQTFGVLGQAFREAVNARVRERLAAEPPKAIVSQEADPLEQVRKAMGL